MLRRRFFASALLTLAAVSSLLGAALPSVTAAAASSTGGNGLRISPVRTDLTIKPGGSQTIDVYVENLTSTKAQLQGVINDFTAGKDESGTPYILLNGERAPSHSLKGYVSPLGSFTLAPKATKDVKVTITIPKGTSGGGYFGAVRFLPVSNSGDKNVNLTASVGSLILVTVPGKVVEQMSLASLDVRHIDTKHNTLSGAQSVFTSSKSLAAVVRFQNSGDLQEQPFGKVILKKGSHIVSSYEINDSQPRGNVLPSSIRRFVVPLKGLGSFGKYTLEGNFGYGAKGQLLTANTTFYVIPILLIVLVVALIALILFAIFGMPRMIRAYNRRVIKRASKRTKQ